MGLPRVRADDDIPGESMTAMRMFPLSGVLLPGATMPLHVFEPRFRALVNDAVDSGEGTFGVVLISHGSEVGGGEQRTDVGTLATIAASRGVPGGGLVIDAVGESRFRVHSWLPDAPYPRGEIEIWPETEAPDDLSAAAEDDLVIEIAVRIVDLGRIAEEMASRRGLFAPPAGTIGEILREVRTTPARRLAYMLTRKSPIGESDKQRILSAESVPEQLRHLATALEDVLAAARFRLQA